jgi:hypothetical protein
LFPIPDYSFVRCFINLTNVRGLDGIVIYKDQFSKWYRVVCTFAHEKETVRAIDNDFSEN